MCHVSISFIVNKSQQKIQTDNFWILLTIVDCVAKAWCTVYFSPLPQSANVAQNSFKSCRLAMLLHWVICCYRHWQSAKYTPRAATNISALNLWFKIVPSTTSWFTKLLCPFFLNWKLVERPGNNDIKIQSNYNILVILSFKAIIPWLTFTSHKIHCQNLLCYIIPILADELNCYIC